MSAEASALAGSGEDGRAEPVRLRLAGSANGVQHVPSLFWAQAHRKHFSKCVFLRQSRPAHFLSHTKKSFCLQKVIDDKLFFVYRKSSLNCEAESCQQKCPHVSGMTSRPKTPGGNRGGQWERLAMNARLLKIERTGDFWRGRVKPQIRLKGEWLNRAGFKPGLHVEIRFGDSGCMTLRATEEKEAAS